jgi:hypothetical protein
VRHQSHRLAGYNRKGSDTAVPGTGCKPDRPVPRELSQLQSTRRPNSLRRDLSVLEAPLCFAHDRRPHLYAGADREALPRDGWELRRDPGSLDAPRPIREYTGIDVRFLSFAIAEHSFNPSSAANKRLHSPAGALKGRGQDRNIVILSAGFARRIPLSLLFQTRRDSSLRSE